jgi:serine/threonine protein kinase
MSYGDHEDEDGVCGTEYGDPSTPIRDLEIDRNKQLGHGAHGKVFLASWRNNTVAVKEFTGPWREKRFLREVTVMQKFNNSPYQISLLTYSFHQTLIVIPYKPNGDLRSYLRTRKQTLNDQQLRSLARDITSGLHLLHQANCLHGDVSSCNILVNTDGSACLCDFGLSRTNEKMNLYGNIVYVGYEYYVGEPYTFASDIFSLGMVLHELLIGRSPHLKHRERFLREKKEICLSYPTFSRRITDLFVFPSDSPCRNELLTSCMEMATTARPTIHSVSSFFE